MVDDDVPAVAAMCRTVLEETWQNPDTLDSVIEANGSAHAWKSYLDTRRCLVAHRGDDLVGVAWVFIADVVAHVGGAFVVHRGEGIGGELLAERLAFAEQQHCNVAHATVVVGNEASRRNLERAGFQLVDESAHEWTFTRPLRPSRPRGTSA